MAPTRPAHCPAPLQDTHPACLPSGPAGASLRPGWRSAPSSLTPPSALARGRRLGRNQDGPSIPGTRRAQGQQGHPGWPREHEPHVPCPARPPPPLWRQPPRASCDMLRSPVSEDGPRTDAPGVALWTFMRSCELAFVLGQPRPVQGCVTRPKSAFLPPTLSVH